MSDPEDDIFAYRRNLVCEDLTNDFIYVAWSEVLQDKFIVDDGANFLRGKGWNPESAEDDGLIDWGIQDFVSEASGVIRGFFI